MSGLCTCGPGVFDELDVDIVVLLHLGFETPVSVFVDLVHDMREGGGIGGDALEEPGGCHRREGTRL